MKNENEFKYHGTQMKIKLIYPKIREVISYKYASKFMGIKSSSFMK
jgi:hypothetical protein